MSSPLTIRTREFFVESRDHDRSHTILSITEPKDAEEAVLKGTLFVLFEIEQGNARMVEYVQDTVRFVERSYYEEFAAERNHFEDTVMRTNQLLRGFTVPTNTGVHALIGVVKKSELSFTAHGSPDMWLFVRGLERPHALLPHDEEEKEKESPSSFFSELIVGTLSIQDIVLVTSTHVRDYFTADRLGKMVRGHSSEEISRHLERILKELGSGLSFAGVVLEAVPAPGAKSIVTRPAGSNASIEAFLSGQEKTAEFLAPTIFRNTWLWFHQQWAARPRSRSASHRPHGTPTRTHGPASEQFLLGHTLWYLIKSAVILLGRLLRGILILLWRGLILLTAFFRSSPSERKVLQSETKRSVRGRIATWYRRFRSLPPRKQARLSIASLIFVLAVGGGTTLIYQRVQAREARMTAQLVQDITRRHEEAQAKIIYGADAEARMLLREAEQLITQLPKRGAANKQVRGQLAGIVATALAELRKEILVQPTLVVPITDVALARPRALALYGEEIMIGSAHTSRAVLVKLTSGTTREVGTPNPLTNAYAIDKTVWWQLGTGIAPINSDGAAGELFGQLGNASDYVIFNQGLYVLRPDEEQIIRYPARGETFSGSGQPWIKEQTVLPLDARFLAIDGDLYVVSANGSVQKLRRGVAIPFNLTPIDPDITRVTDVWTNEKSSFIYILDAEGGRMVVFNKEGKLRAQYRADALKTATGFLVDEKKKTAYLAVDEGVISFDLIHLP
ncbi:MAG: hypothetical protein HY437_01755 [Candidatus Magasanikbacteria bacterium]|nr:hypothetical protein [Candidatus Magasanikbacteria bacterium]